MITSKSELDISGFLNAVVSEADISLTEAAKVAGISPDSMGEYVRGDRKATPLRVAFLKERFKNPKGLRQELDAMKAASVALDRRRIEKKWTLDRLADEAGVKYYKVWEATHGGYVEPDVLAAIEAALTSQKDVIATPSPFATLTDTEKLELADSVIETMQKLISARNFSIGR